MRVKIIGRFLPMVLVIALSLLMLSIILQVIDVEGEVRHQAVWIKDLGDDVYSVCWSPDGERIAVVGAFKRIVLFNIKGEILWERKVLACATCASISPLGDYLAVLLGSHDLVVYSLIDGLNRWGIRIGERIDSISWSPDGKYLAIGESDGDICLYNRIGKVVWSKRITDSSIHCLCFNPEGTKLLVGSMNGYIYLIDLNGTIVWSRDLDNYVESIYYDSKGEYLVAVTVDAIYIIKSDNGEIMWSLDTRTPHYCAIWYGDYIITGDSYGYVYFYKWIEKERKAINVYKFKATKEKIPRYGLSFNSKYYYLAVASKDNHVYVYNVSKVFLIPFTSTSTITHTIKTITVTNTLRLFSTKTVTKTTTLIYRETLTKVVTQPRLIITTTIKEISYLTRTLTTTIINIIEKPSRISMEALILSLMFIIVGLITSLFIRRKT